MTSPEQKISQYHNMHGVNPSTSWLAVACKITPHQAERLLSQGSLFDEQSNESQVRSEIPAFPRTEQASFEVPIGVRTSNPRVNTNDRMDKGSDEANRREDIPGNARSSAIQPVESDDAGRAGSESIPLQSDILQPGLPIETKGAGFIDRIVTKFIGGIKSFVFLSASFGDLALTVFFYWSLGYDIPSKLIWGLWAVTQTLGKLYLWHINYKKSATWAAVLSVIATVSIFLAVVDTQSISTVANNTAVKSPIELQIDAKISENSTLNARLAATPPDYVGASKTITDTIKANDTTLKGLRDELKADKQTTENPKQFELSAWVIFGQITNFKWNDLSHIFALVLILGIAVFFEVLIYATTPREAIYGVCATE